MDKVVIQNMHIRGILGIHDWERVTQREIIDMAKKLRTHAESAARMTVEALANDLAEICLQEPKVMKVILRVDKPGAVAEADSVAVEVEREKQAKD